MDHPWLLLVNALVLGFRHGIDWDHIAAITDIVGTTSSDDKNNMPVQRRSLVLSSMYALGHASVVAFLGVCALYFAAVLPSWVDPIMERLVGYTLLLLGVWVCVALIRHLQDKEDFQLQSRWMLLFAFIARSTMWLQTKLNGQRTSSSPSLPVRKYGGRAAFSVGMIHGIGAETGTQVLLLAAIGGAASHGLGMAMLALFLVGLLASNTLVAVLGSAGFITSRRMKPLYITAGALTCGFSLVIGAYFVLGQSQRLPDLKHLLGAA